MNAAKVPLVVTVRHALAYTLSFSCRSRTLRSRTTSALKLRLQPFRPSSAMEVSSKGMHITRRLCFSAPRADSSKSSEPEPLAPRSAAASAAAYVSHQGPMERLPEGLTVVNDEQSANRALEVLLSLPPEAPVAWDTEVADIDVTTQSPVGNGRVICATAFAGDSVDFGTGPRLWIDNDGPAEGVIDLFKAYFEDDSRAKAFHNFGFDRHVLYNHGIDVLGLCGDTMHMARTWSSARSKQGGYSLEALSQDLLGHRKVPMKERFAVRRLKRDGTEGKDSFVPPVHMLQRLPHWRSAWIDYATYDAEATWRLREDLEARLRQRPWAGGQSLWEFYTYYVVPFAVVLTDMERQGIRVDVAEHLPRAEELARREQEDSERLFLEWATSLCPEASRMNPGSDPQKAHFLFAPCRRLTKSQQAARDRRKRAAEKYNKGKGGDYKQPQEGMFAGGQAALDSSTYGSMHAEQQAKAKAKRKGKGNGKGAAAFDDETVEELEAAAEAGDPDVWPRHRAFKVENTEGFIEEGKKKAKKMRDMVLVGQGIEPVTRTDKGWPAVSAAVLRELAGDPESEPPRWGRAYEHFGGGQEGERACRAIAAAHNAGAVYTMLASFILPLQQMADKDSRVHCSLNLNTETGRLSARRPNLQNQPALEKDRYGIRKAFHAKPGCSLLVADYGQLELRVLAHMARCSSMIEAFELGGDFHSRTALDMYEHIREAVDKGEVLLEWDGKGEPGPDGGPPKPLIKNVYASERRKAKVLNFSIAYGKTAVGLSKDWGVSIDEAKDTLQRWYDGRPEVRDWQSRVLEIARREGATRTLMGRYRDLPHINSSNRGLRGHAERAAINTPIQGGAADVVMMAMLNIARDERLKKIGWKMLLQIHDEVILEGPSETAREAQRCLVEDMERPFEKPLLVDLVVDSQVAQTWYEAK